MIKAHGLSKAGAPVDDLYEIDEAGCWIFQGRGLGGYGRLRRDGKIWMAHRFFWTLTHGPIADGMTVDHICFVTMCVNPEHLQLLTPGDNAARQRKTFATHCQRGHEFTPENTWTKSRGEGRLARRCKECQRGRIAARKAAASAVAA
jgi:hypothetical protein